MQEAQIWRSLLADVLKRPGQQQWIASALGVNPFTLRRWVQGQTKPRPRYLRQLLTLLSEQPTAQRSLLAQAFPEITSTASATTERPPEIASHLYAEVLQLLTNSPFTLDLQSVRKRLLQEALEQLDSSQISLTITLLRCVPPSTGQKVRSLQVMMGVGLPPWGGDLGQQRVFFGAESVAGRVASTGLPVTIENCLETRLLASPNIAGIGSLSVYPLRRAGRIAGVLSVLSSEPGYLLAFRNALIEQYSNFVALTFALDDCYALEDMRLRMMPLPSLQMPSLNRFRERVLELLLEAARVQSSMTNAQAEEIVWQRIEEELVQAVFSTGS